MSSSESPQGSRPRPRRLRRTAIAVSIVLALLAVAIATAPAWLSGAIARHLIASNVGSRVRGTVSVADVRLSWPGPQRIQGLAIAGSGGDLLTVDLDVNAGLWGLVRGTAPLRVTASGAIVTRYSDDGVLSIMEALSAPAELTASAPAPTTRTASTDSGPLTMPDALRGASLKIESFDVDATPTGSGPRIAVDGLAGTLAVTDGGATCTLDAATQLGDTKGRLSVKATASKLWNTATGGIDPWHAAVDVTVRGEALPIPAAGMPIEARTLDLDIDASELGKEVSVKGSTQLVLPGGEIGSVSADLTLYPARADATSVASASGTVQLRDVPMSLAAPYLAGTPLDVARDLGSTCDATIAFSDRSGQIELRTQRLEATASLSSDERMENVSASGVTLATTVDPALAKSIGVEIEQPAAVQVLVRTAKIDLPKLAAGDLRGISCDVGMSLAPLRVRAGSAVDAPWIPLGPMSLSASVPNVAEGAQVELDAQAYGAPIRVSAALSGLVDAKGALAAASASAKGSLSAGPLDPASLPWVSDGVRAQLAEAGIGSASVAVQFDAKADAGTALVTLDAAARQSGAPVAQATSALGWSAGAFTAKDTSIAATLARSTLAPWLGEDIELAEDVTVTVRIEPIEIERRPATTAAPASLIWPARVAAAVTAPRVAVRRAPSLTMPVALRDVAVQATVGIDGAKGALTSADASLSAAVIPSLAQGVAEAATVKATYAGPADASRFRAELDLALARGSALASCVDAGVASALLEGPGTVRARVERTDTTDAVSAQVKLPRASAEIDATVAPGSLVVRPSTATMELPVSIIEGALGLREAPDLAATLADPRAPRIRTDVRVESITWTGKAEEAAVVLSASLGAGTLSPPGRPPVAIDGLQLSVASPKLASSAKISVQGRAGVGGAALAPFALGAELSGDLRAALDPAQPLSLSASKASVELPGALAIALTDWWRGGSVATDAVSEVDRIALTIAIASAKVPSRERIGDATVDVTAQLERIRLVPKGKPAVAVGPVRIGIRSARLADRIAVDASGAAAIADPGADAALRTTGEVSVSLAAAGLVGADGAFTADRAQLTGSVRANGFPTVIADTLAGAKGDLVDAIGPAISVELDARASPAADAQRVTELSMNLNSAMVQMQAPRITLTGGALAVSPTQPVQGSITISPALKDWVLEQINPVFSDIVSAPPIRWRVSSLRFPLDLDMRGFDASASVEVGDVRLRPSSDFLGSLVIDTSSTDGTVAAQIEPLRVEVAAGQVRYRDFKVNVGRISGDWQQKLTIAGDIDIVRKPPYAKSISLRVPLQSIARTAGGFEDIRAEAGQITKVFQGMPIDPGEVVVVDLDYSGPLGQVDGKSVPLRMTWKLDVDKSKITPQKVGDAVLDAAGKVLDIFNKRKKP